MLKKSLDVLLYYSIKTLFFLISLLPGFITGFAANIIGRSWYFFDKRHRELALLNLTNAFSDDLSEPEITALAKRNFSNTINIIFEMARTYQWKSESVSGRIRVTGIDHLKKAHAKNKGILFLTGHVGNWEMSVHLKHLAGVDGSGVYRRLDSPSLDRYVLEKRQMTGCRMYPVKDAVMGIFYELGQGNFTGILCDQNAKRSQGVFVDFFGRKACTNKGLAQFSMATDAPVLPYFFLREEGTFLLEIGEEIPLVDTGNKETDIIANTQNYTNVIEDVIRRFPDQWLWVHNRWKTQPLNG